VASAPDCRIAVQGIGPRVWLENTGPWQAQRHPLLAAFPAEHPDVVLDSHPEFGDRGTVLAVTGDDVDAAEIAALLTGSELTEAEMASGPGALNDPFDLNRTTETTQRSNP
jgi:hypothetical protein